MTTADAVVTDTADVPNRTPIAEVDDVDAIEELPNRTISPETVVDEDALRDAVLVNTSGLSYLPES